MLLLAQEALLLQKIREDLHGLLETLIRAWATSFNNSGFDSGDFTSWGPRQPSEIGSTYQIVSPGTEATPYCGQMYVDSNSSESAKFAVYLTRTDIPTAAGWIVAAGIAVAAGPARTRRRGAHIAVPTGAGRVIATRIAIASPRSGALV